MELEREWLLEIKIINQHIISTMKKTTSNSRRSFLRNAATIAAGISIVPRHVLGRGFLAPSDQLTKGIIGVDISHMQEQEWLQFAM